LTVIEAMAQVAAERARSSAEWAEDHRRQAEEVGKHSFDEDEDDEYCYAEDQEQDEIDEYEELADDYAPEAKNAETRLTQLRECAWILAELIPGLPRRGAIGELG
jgi:hypothetical protein